MTPEPTARDEGEAEVLAHVPSDLAAHVVEAIGSLGGEAQRREIIDRALEVGGWTPEQLAVESWYSGAARKYHLRTLADYAIDVLRRRGELEPGTQPGRWRLTGADGAIVPKPLGEVFTAAVGVAGNPVDDRWRADEYAREFGHIWFAQSSNQLSAGDHLFAIGVSRGRAVLGLFEVLSAGDLRQPRNPWEPDRWPYATAVRALASVPPTEATSVAGVRTPRATAYRVADEGQRVALYEAMRGYEVDGAPITEGERPVGLAERLRALRRPRPFDPDAAPAERRSDRGAVGRDEAEDLREKAAQGHHALLVRLFGALHERGWTDIEEIPLAIDLRGRAPDTRIVIFEAKTITADNETGQCRSGLAQLLEYRQDYGSPDDALCLVVDRTLSERRSDILDRLGIAAVVASQTERLCSANSTGERLLDADGRPGDDTAAGRAA